MDTMFQIWSKREYIGVSIWLILIQRAKSQRRRVNATTNLSPKICKNVENGVACLFELFLYTIPILGSSQLDCIYWTALGLQTKSFKLGYHSILIYVLQQLKKKHKLFSLCFTFAICGCVPVTVFSSLFSLFSQ